MPDTIPHYRTCVRPQGFLWPHDRTGRVAPELQSIEERIDLEVAEHGAELVLVVTGNKARTLVGGSGPGRGSMPVMEPDWATFQTFAEPP